MEDQLKQYLKELLGIEIDSLSDGFSIVDYDDYIKDCVCKSLSLWRAAVNNSKELMESEVEVIDDPEEDNLLTSLDFMTRAVFRKDYQYEIVLWWIYERDDYEDPKPGLLDEDDNEHDVETPEQLYDLLEKVDRGDVVLKTVEDFLNEEDEDDEDML